MGFLKFIKRDNRGGDVGMTGMLFILVTLTVMTIALDLFANMISKEYVIEKMQAAQTYTLVSNYDSEKSTFKEIVFRDVLKMRTDYKNYLSNYLDIGNTVFNDIKIGEPVFMCQNKVAEVVEGNVTYEPHQFIRNPTDALFRGIDVKNPVITTKVRTMLTVYRTKNDEFNPL